MFKNFTIIKSFFFIGIPFFLIGLIMISLPEKSIFWALVSYTLFMFGFLFAFLFSPLLFFVDRKEKRRLAKYDNDKFKNKIITKYNLLKLKSNFFDALYTEGINKIESGINPKKVDEWLEVVKKEWEKDLNAEII